MQITVIKKLMEYAVFHLESIKVKKEVEVQVRETEILTIKRLKMPGC